MSFREYITICNIYYAAKRSIKILTLTQVYRSAILYLNLTSRLQRYFSVPKGSASTLYGKLFCCAKVTNGSRKKRIDS